MVLIRAHDELNSACPFPRSAGESSLRVQLGTPLPLQHGRAGIRCQEQPNLGATSGRATTSAGPARSSHTRPSVWRALTAAAAGWGCGSACPAAGWPAPTTPLTSTPRRTIKRPTIPWSSRWSMTIASAGVTSISGPSDTPRSTRASRNLREVHVVAPDRWNDRHGLAQQNLVTRRERPRAFLEDRVRAGVRFAFKAHI
jgi:hypothetical protein